MSAKRGVAPACTTTLAVAQNVSGVVITSSPGPMREASSARCSAAVHGVDGDRRVRRRRSPQTRARTACTRGPVDSQPDRSVATTSSISASPIDGGANRTSAGCVSCACLRHRRHLWPQLIQLRQVRPLAWLGVCSFAIGVLHRSAAVRCTAVRAPSTPSISSSGARHVQAARRAAGDRRSVSTVPT